MKLVIFLLRTDYENLLILFPTIPLFHNSMLIQQIFYSNYFTNIYQKRKVFEITKLYQIPFFSWFPF